MAACFAAGSLCFVIGPFPGYAKLVGTTADGLTFFVGSLLFTAGGALQVRLASGARGPAWWSAVIQSAGTLCFNVTTFRALQVSFSDADYDRLVWRPDAVGSVCFLVSGIIAYRDPASRGWQPLVNLLGCVLFAISAVAGYLVPSRGTVLDLAWANWTTALGAMCFLVVAVSGLRPVTDRGRGAPPRSRPVDRAPGAAAPR
jgi:hypothetical protein